MPLASLLSFPVSRRSIHRRAAAAASPTNPPVTMPNYSATPAGPSHRHHQADLPLAGLSSSYRRCSSLEQAREERRLWRRTLTDSLWHTSSSASLLNTSGQQHGTSNSLLPLERAVVQLRVAASGDRAAMEAAVAHAEAIAAESLNRPHMASTTGAFPYYP